MENNIANINTVRNLLRSYQIREKKSYGQNFLIDNNVVLKIINLANITTNTIVIEIGPGLGALTQKLVNMAYEVYAIEKDSDMVEILNDNLIYDNLTIFNDDILDFDLDKFLENLKSKNKEIVLISNLPYYITSDILLKLYSLNNLINKIVIMTQKELAERLFVDNDDKDYRAITLLTKRNYQLVNKALISKNVFYPKPRVMSQVMVLEKKAIEEINNAEFTNFVNNCFKYRRKTIENNLNKFVSKELGEKILNTLNIDKKIRVEKLTVTDFERMFDIYYKEEILRKD